ncbi:MAG: efflux RND transporter periplasmic adaptor subunit [Deltaproteobacteria bacterium]|nr:MAG: efflux RND transporter periplasmic adaptor subunit [Deltaproteobacteria bacterium]
MTDSASDALWRKPWVRRGGFALLAVFLFVGWRMMRPAPKVQVVQPAFRNVVELVIASGRIRSKEMSSLGAEISGVVERMWVDEGDKVKKGQKLARLSKTDVVYRIQQSRLSVRTAQRQLQQVRRGPLAADISQARADIALARSRRIQATQELTRAKRLLKSNTISKAEYDRAVSTLVQARASERSARARLQRLRTSPRPEDVSVARARVQEARAALRTLLDQANKREIVAPFNGVIVQRPVSVGQVINPGTPLFVLANTEHVEIYAEVDENKLSKLRTGQTAIVIAGAYKKRSFLAKLTQISPMVDYQRGLVGLRFTPQKLPSYALLNMSVDVNIQTQEWKNSLSLPIQTLVKRDGKDYVMVVKKKRTALQPIKIRGKNSDWLVCEGVPKDAKVVVDGNRWEPGTKVRTKPWKAPQAGRK